MFVIIHLCALVCGRLLAGNTLQCSCENVWLKQWRGEESEELMCVEEGGKRRALAMLTLPNCGKNYLIKTIQIKTIQSRLSFYRGHITSYQIILDLYNRSSLKIVL